ncbi:iron-containing alcohol dehydrogenase [Sphingomonas bacterium]|uniref:iron-containing alcohol dehydrogenase n=1 Tax=Sphingomonas bacterium TaxID=1895847 RepID=UPI001575E950|nr:iron-containing alcohol dehydrogenase [Sphingomonas bacterium]
MGPALVLPRLVFGAGGLAVLGTELALLGVRRPLLISDRGLEGAGLVAAVERAVPDFAAMYLDVPENPTAAGADGAFAAYRAAGCDGVVALGGGSVLDTAKIVAALAGGTVEGGARDLIGKPELIGAVVPLVAIPTTIGTGSECSPVAALHLVAGGPGFGTRHPLLVPRVALCDPDLTRTLPKRLIAATAIDALSHCVEGFFANPANPLIDALALDGAARVFADVHKALEPDGDAARASLMAAAFSGGAAIHKGLGPAHAVALVCGDQDVHHGTLIGVALPRTTHMLAEYVPDKAARLARAIGLGSGEDLADALRALVKSLGLPATLAASGYRTGDRAKLVDDMVRSHFNRTSPYVPTNEDYQAILTDVAA